MDRACRKTGLQGRKVDTHPERVVAALAARQHGVVSLGQLERAGVSATAVHKRCATGRLQRVHRGVYAVGPAPLGHRARCMAAVLACGPACGVSHTTAAGLWAIVQNAGAHIHVTVATAAGRRAHGLVVHRSSTLIATDLVSVDGIPCTGVARTLLDLADVVDIVGLARALEAAERLRLFDQTAVDAVLGRAGGRHAARRLRTALAAYSGAGLPARSELERRALELFERAGLPRPRVNTLVHTDAGVLEVDFCWPDWRLIVEADSFEFHGTQAAFERDRRRDQLLRAAGWTPVRITWRQVNEAPGDVIGAVLAN